MLLAIPTNIRLSWKSLPGANFLWLIGTIPSNEEIKVCENGPLFWLKATTKTNVNGCELRAIHDIWTLFLYLLGHIGTKLFVVIYIRF
jgi:hypothetical protein